MWAVAARSRANTCLVLYMYCTVPTDWDWSGFDVKSPLQNYPWHTYWNVNTNRNRMLRIVIKLSLVRSVPIVFLWNRCLWPGMLVYSEMLFFENSIGLFSNLHSPLRTNSRQQRTDGQRRRATLRWDDNGGCCRAFRWGSFRTILVFIGRRWKERPDL